MFILRWKATPGKTDMRSSPRLFLILLIGFPVVVGQTVTADMRSRDLSVPPDEPLEGLSNGDVKQDGEWYSGAVPFASGRAGRAQVVSNLDPLTLHFRPPDCNLTAVTYSRLLTLPESLALNNDAIENGDPFDVFQLRVDKKPIHKATATYQIRNRRPIQEWTINDSILRHFNVELNDRKRFVEEVQTGQTLRLKYRGPWHGDDFESYAKVSLAGSNKAIQRAKTLCRESVNEDNETPIEDYFKESEISEGSSTNSEYDRNVDETLRTTIRCSALFLTVNQLIETTETVASEAKQFSTTFDNMAKLTYLEAEKRSSRERVNTIMQEEVDDIVTRIEKEDGLSDLIEQRLNKCLDLVKEIR